VADVGPEGGLLSVKLVDGADGAVAVVLAVEEGVGVCVGVAVGDGEGELVGLSLGGAVVGCGVGSEVVGCPEQAAKVSAAKEERVRAVRRLTDHVEYFIRT
jgi:hypothetical protein